MITPLWFTREIFLGDSGPDVKVVRRKLGFLEDGPYDLAVQQKVMGMARKTGTQTSGEVNSAVADKLGETEANKAGTLPGWYTREVGLWEEGEDVRSVRRILGLGDSDNRFDPDAESAVRRLQSSLGLPLTGKVDEPLARHLGEV